MARNIRGRLERLEDTVQVPREDAEDSEKKRWFSRTRLLRGEALAQPDAAHARSLIRLFRVQNILEDMDAEEVIERSLDWNPKPETGRRRSIVEREVYLAVYRGEPGTGHMDCSLAWSEAFAAGDEFLRRYEAIPDEVLARGYVELGSIEENGEEYARWRERYEDAYGLTEQLIETTLGPDQEDVPEDELTRRLEEYMAPALYGEKGYRVWRRMETPGGCVVNG